MLRAQGLMAFRLLGFRALGFDWLACNTGMRSLPHCAICILDCVTMYYVYHVLILMMIYIDIEIVSAISAGACSRLPKLVCRLEVVVAGLGRRNC